MRRLVLITAPLWLTAALFLLVLRSGDPAPLWRAHLPREPFLADRCTWYCHNHGCRHRPVLPAFFSGDAYLFGRAIAGLRAAGRVAVPGRPDIGYGVANLAAFCVLWPGLMYGLYLVALWQRGRLRREHEFQPGQRGQA